MAITNDYVDYADATGAVMRLPVPLGTPCSARKAPADLTPAEIASMIPDLPTPPAGFAWQRKNCSIVDGPWAVDPDRSFTPVQTPTTPNGAIPVGDRAGQELVGYFQSNQSVH